MFLLGAILAAAACSDSGTVGVDGFAPPSVQSSIVTASVTPETIVLQPGEAAEFTVAFSDVEGNGIKGPVLWSATGGSINRNATVGTYVAGQTPGDYQVIAKAPATGVSDTARVTIQGSEEKAGGSDSGSGDSGDDGGSKDPGDDGGSNDPGDDGGSNDPGDDGGSNDPGDDGGSDNDGDGSDNSSTVSQVEVSPEKATLNVGETVRFDALLRDSGGNPVDGTVTWRATGGAISDDGLYTAGTADGSYSVTASHEDSGTLDEATVQIESTSSGSEKLNFYSGFEAGDLGEWNQTELCCSYSAQVVNTVAREGKRSVRLELHRDERKAELRNVPWKSSYGFAGRLNGPEMWYGISIYVPDWYVPTSGDYQLVWQVHVPPGDGQKWQQPHFAAWLNAKGWSYTSRSGVDGSQRQKQFNIGSVRTNGWTDFVVRAVWRNDSNGILQIWMNGRLVVDERGPNAYGDRTREYYNAADFYRAGSSWPASPGTRDLYFDAIRVYEGTNGYDAVAPR